MNADLKKIFSNKKVLIGVSFFILLMLIVFVSVLSQSAQQKAQQQASEQQDGQPTTPEKLDYINPNTDPSALAEPAEVNEVKKEYRERLQKKGITPKEDPTYQFEYIYDEPQPQGFNILGEVWAAPRLCNTVGLPEKVDVYKLRAHWTQDEAKEFAAKVIGPAEKSFSQPSTGTGFMYFMETKHGYVRLQEASGAFDTHLLLEPLEATDRRLTIGDAKVRARQLFTKLGINENITLDAEQEGPVHSVNYIRELPYKLGDESAIRNASKLGSLCLLDNSSSMTLIDYTLASNNEYERMSANIRHIVDSTLVDRLTPEEATKSKPLINPIVITAAGAAAAPETGKVIIDEVIYSYFDLGGEVYAQDAYVPVYITGGTLEGTSTKVYSVFSAAKTDELEKSGFYDERKSRGGERGIPAEDSGLKQGTFDYEATAAPTPGTMTKKDPGKNSCVGIYNDYGVKCSADGQKICSTFYQDTKARDRDPMGICSDGTVCVSQDDVVTSKVGESPCLTALKNQGAPVPGDAGVIGMRHSIKSLESSKTLDAGTPVSCVVYGCPCEATYSTRMLQRGEKLDILEFENRKMQLDQEITQ